MGEHRVIYKAELIIVGMDICFYYSSNYFGVKVRAK